MKSGVFKVLVLLGVSLTASAQAWPEERFFAAFYNNLNMSGFSSFAFEEDAIDHDWGEQSPDIRIIVNGWAARWRGVFQLDKGTWRFKVKADDGVRVWVDERLIVDQMGAHDTREIDELIYLEAGKHRIEIQYFDYTGEAGIQVEWERYVPPQNCVSDSGSWCAQYYNNTSLSGNPVWTEAMAPGDKLGGDTPAGLPVPWSGRWQGRFTFDEGWYYFTAAAVDGARVWVDGHLIIDHWEDGPEQEHGGYAFMDAGEHHVLVEGYRSWGDRIVRLFWNKDAGEQALNQSSPLGVNITALFYYSTEWPLLDAMKAAGGWYTQNDSTWDTREQDKLDLDENGWVRSLPAEDDPDAAYRFVGALMLNNTEGTHPAGRYTVLYDGQGKLSYGFDARYNEELSVPGRHVLDLDEPSNGGIVLRILETDPTDYIRNIRVILPGYRCAANPYEVCDGTSCGAQGCVSLESLSASLRFHPHFLRDLRGYQVIRFMDFLRTNTNTHSRWSERPHPDHARWNTTEGAPLEVAIDLANEAGVDPWFCVPTRADDDYVRQMAALTLERLAPNRKVYVEYSNEIWNTAFSNGNWVEANAVEMWPDDPRSSYTKRLSWFGMRSSQIVGIWKEVWGDQANRVKGVMGGFSAQAWTSEQALVCPLYADAEKGIPPCYENMDALAIAPYFGAYVGQDRYADRVANWFPYSDGGLNILFLELSQGGFLYHTDDPPEQQAPKDGAVAKSIEYMTSTAQIANRYNLDMIAYEAGQHLAGVGPQLDNASLTELFTHANRDPRMYDLYTQYMNGWRAAGGRLMCHFLSVESYGKFGSWGSKEFQEQTGAPKYKALMDFVENNPCWWEGCVSVPESIWAPFIPRIGW